MAKTSDNKPVFTNFIPSSDKLAPLAANVTKANKAASDALEALRTETFKALVKAGTVTADLEGRFRVNYRWGQFSWYIQSEAGAAKGKGMEL